MKSQGSFMDIIGAGVIIIIPIAFFWNYELTLIDDQHRPFGDTIEVKIILLPAIVDSVSGAWWPT